MAQVDKPFENTWKKVEEQLVRLTNKIGLMLVKAVQDIMDKNKINVTGQLRKSISYKIDKKTTEILLTVISGVKYDIYRHEGTKPHFPPIEPLRTWVIKKGLAQRTSKTGSRTYIKNINTVNNFNIVNGIAWAIARSISRKGTMGIKFFQLALNQSKPIIEREVSNFRFEEL